MRRPGLRARTARVLAIFVATIVVAGLAPWVEAHAWERVCSVHGDRWIDAHGHAATNSTGSGTGDDHAAHCALCVPVAAPPSAFVAITPPAQPPATLATRRYAARLAVLVGAPFPPRAPPHHA